MIYILSAALCFFIGGIYTQGQERVTCEAEKNAGWRDVFSRQTTLTKTEVMVDEQRVRAEICEETAELCFRMMGRIAGALDIMPPAERNLVYFEAETDKIIDWCLDPPKSTK